ncbi:MAG: ATP-binding protein [Steroidobacter sp.]
MAFNRFETGILPRAAILFCTMGVLAWVATQTRWYATMLVLGTTVIFQMVLMLRFVTHTSREIARFFDAVAFDDGTATFTSLSNDGRFAELGAAMGRVLEQLRVGRLEREEQTHYFQSLIAHVPISLISVGDDASVQLLNHAARHLFEGPCHRAEQFSRYGELFATGIEHLTSGETAILRMARSSGVLQLKAAATDIRVGGTRKRLISLQNIENELSAQELAAWQSVIRVMTHEVMNSLTPISSLAATAQGLMADILAKSSLDESDQPTLHDIQEALETLTRRSEGLLHFVQNHRRLTKPLLAKIEVVSVRRIFARLQRLLADELKNRNIMLDAIVTPETLEVSVDSELLDQALINLVRNAVDALKDTPEGRITLSAVGNEPGHVKIAVADNGPGIPIDLREKVFVPFFTTKRQGSGVGLTLVRQIATLHGASVRIAESQNGGATITLIF